MLSWKCGNGYFDAERYCTSDQQLFFFLLMGEYLLLKRDYGFPAENVACHPYRGEPPMPVWRFVRNCFGYLHDALGKGSHGIVRLLNSDWNDAVCYIEKQPYNNGVFSGESHMNSAMACAVIPALVREKEKYDTSSLF